MPQQVAGKTPSSCVVQGVRFVVTLFGDVDQKKKKKNFKMVFSLFLKQLEIREMQKLNHVVVLVF